MNKYIEEYLEKKAAERRAEQQREAQEKIMKMAQQLKIGEREYNEDEIVGTSESYPHWDRQEKCAFRYNVGDVTVEDYEALAALFRKEEVKVKPAERSGWYTFAVIMIVIGGLGVLSAFVAVVADDSYRKVWTPFWISLVSYLFVVGFFGIIMLLSQIKETLDNIMIKSK